MKSNGNVSRYKYKLNDLKIIKKMCRINFPLPYFKILISKKMSGKCEKPACVIYCDVQTVERMRSGKFQVHL